MMNLILLGHRFKTYDFLHMHANSFHFEMLRFFAKKRGQSSTIANLPFQLKPKEFIQV